MEDKFMKNIDKLFNRLKDPDLQTKILFYMLAIPLIDEYLYDFYGKKYSTFGNWHVIIFICIAIFLIRFKKYKSKSDE